MYAYMKPDVASDVVRALYEAWYYFVNETVST